MIPLDDKMLEVVDSVELKDSYQNLNGKIL